MTNENDPANHTLHLLRDMRETMGKRFDDMDKRLDGLETEMRTGFASVNERLDALEGVFGGLSFIAADARGEIEAIKARLDALEARV